MEISQGPNWGRSAKGKINYLNRHPRLIEVLGNINSETGTVALRACNLCLIVCL
jgi:hypothetical protein